MAVNYHIKCETLVINNGKGDEKDKEIENLKNENRLLRAQMLQRNITDDTVSNSTTDYNVTTHGVIRNEPQTPSLPSQPLTNRFPSRENDLNNSRDGNGIIKTDCEETQAKLVEGTTSRVARAERPYDEVDTPYLDYPLLGDYKNFPPLLRKRTVRFTDERTSVTKTTESTKQNRRYVRAPPPRYLNPVLIDYDGQQHKSQIPMATNRMYHERKSPEPTPVLASEDENGKDTDNYIYEPVQFSGNIEQSRRVTPNVAYPQHKNSNVPMGCPTMSYTKVVDVSYLTKSKPTLNTDQANNYQRGETKPKTDKFNKLNTIYFV